MKKIQFALIVLSLLIAINNIDSNAAEVDTDGWITLENEEYEVDYPSDWELDESGKMGTSFFLYSPLKDGADNFMENVNMMHQDMTAYDVTFDEFVKLSEEQVAKMMTDGELEQSEKIERNGQSIHKLVFTGKQGVLDLKFVQYYMMKDSEVYFLTLTCEVSEFENYIEIGETILDSFVLK